MSGRYSTWFRGGAEGGTTLETITQSLIAARGTAFDSGDVSLVWLEAHAHARAVWAFVSAQRRLANQFIPSRMTDFLSRWEKILGIRPTRAQSTSDRRDAVAARMALIGNAPNAGQFAELLQAVCPNTFSSLVHNTSSTAVATTTSVITVPGGVTTVASPTVTWASGIAHLCVLLTKPSTMTEAKFYTEAGKVDAYLDNWAPAWVTFAWARDGGSGTGFFLDDAHNLDNERFA